MVRLNTLLVPFALPTNIRNRAAQYVRMSTDHQKYSIDNQAAAIAEYAAARGLTITRTYADPGRSGLHISGRHALRRLIEDVLTKHVDFGHILVFDVTRWGRFQDVDESAHYEFLCRRAGVVVHYCNEMFENDGSLVTTIVKNVKRVMAGEYSRELSAKIFAGQCRLARMGYRQGGQSGYGLRRQIVDEHGVPKTTLSFGEHKGLQADRTILVPGPRAEIQAVRRVYRLFVVERKSERAIVDLLNEEKWPRPSPSGWHHRHVHDILTNEKYVGNCVYNRTSAKLAGPSVVNRKDDWVRAVGAYEAIVEPELFNEAQQIILGRRIFMSTDEMLAGLRKVLAEHGELSEPLINKAKGLPHSTTYYKRFGSIEAAYRAAGYMPAKMFRNNARNDPARKAYISTLDALIEGAEKAGCTVVHDASTDILTINGEFTLSVIAVRCNWIKAGVPRWRVQLRRNGADFTVIVRLNEGNSKVRDYLVLPAIDTEYDWGVKLRPDNGTFLDSYRFRSLDGFLQRIERADLSHTSAKQNGDQEVGAEAPGGRRLAHEGLQSEKPSDTDQLPVWLVRRAHASVREMFKTYQTEVQRQRNFVRKASVASKHLQSLLNGLRVLLNDNVFVSRLMAVVADSIPKVLTDRLTALDQRSASAMEQAEAETRHPASPRMIEGVLSEAVDLLRGKPVPLGTVATLRRMNPERQLHVAKLMVATGNFTSGYGMALLAATKQQDLADPNKPMRLRCLSAQQMARMESEMEVLAETFQRAALGYGNNVIDLVIATSYLRRLLRNDGLVRYLRRNHGACLRNFRSIVRASSLAPGTKLGKPARRDAAAVRMAASE